MQDLGITNISFFISASIEKKLTSLAEHRYPGAENSIDLVLEDALEWQLTRWDRYGQGIRDFIWLQLAFYGLIPLFKAFAWGRLIEPYFNTMGG